MMSRGKMLGIACGIAIVTLAVGAVLGSIIQARLWLIAAFGQIVAWSVYLILFRVQKSKRA